MGRFIVTGMITRARATASMATATATTTDTVISTAVGRKLRKVSTSSPPRIAPYNVDRLRNRRDRKRNHNSMAATEMAVANLRILEGVEEYCCSGEVNVKSGVNSDGNKVAEVEVEVTGALCCSINVASSSSESESVKECTATTSEIVADPKVESGETSSRLRECCEAARESDCQESPTTIVKSTVQIKMPSESEIDDFFDAAEKDLHERFSNKYNFDVVKEFPLEGRYEWVQMKS